LRRIAAHATNRKDNQMRTAILYSVVILGLVLLAGCQVETVQPATVEVTRVIPQTQLVTAEVTRRVPETQPVTVEVTRVVRKNVVVTATPQPSPALVIEQTAGLLRPRSHHVATRLADGRVLLTGGSQAPDKQLADVEVFDPASGTSSPAAALWVGRHDHSATLLNDGRVLVVAGYDASQQWVTDAEIYNPSTNEWVVVAPLYPHGVGHTATLLNDGRVLVVGGCIGSGVCTDRVEIFDPGTNQWSEAASLPSDRASHTAQVLKDGRVLIAGGGSAAGVPAGGDALLYDPVGNFWTAGGSMLVPRLFAQSLRLDDGRVLVVGGINLTHNFNFSVVPEAELYDPASNTWSGAGALAQGRFAFVLARFPDGHVLVYGGSRDYGVGLSQDSCVREIELYDPQTNSWITVGEVPQLNAYPAGAVLADGRVWVAGGQAGEGPALFWSSSWLIGLTFNAP
jgi:hypothetical protein